MFRCSCIVRENGSGRFKRWRGYGFLCSAAAYISFAVIAVLTGVFLWFFLPIPFRDPPSEAPSQFPTTETNFPTSFDFKYLCTKNDNPSRLYDFLRRNENERVYMIEMIRFKDKEVTQQYDETYMEEIENLAERIVFYLEDGDNVYDRILITEYLGGQSFKENVLEGIESRILEKRAQILERDDIFLAKLNSDVERLYSRFVEGVDEDRNNRYNPVTFHVHGMKFAPNGGRDDVTKFDDATFNLKADNSIFVQAWFDIEATCTTTSGNSDALKYDQVRIESIRDWDDYANILPQARWVNAQRDRQDGLDSVFSFSETMEAGLYQRMYNP